MRKCILMLLVIGSVSAADKPKPQPRDMADVLERAYQQEANIEVARKGGNQLILDKLTKDSEQERKAWNGIPIRGQGKVEKVRGDDSGLWIDVTMQTKQVMPVATEKGYWLRPTTCLIHLQMADRQDEVARRLLRGQIVDFGGKMTYSSTPVWRAGKKSSAYGVSDCKLKLVEAKKKKK